MTHLGKNEIFRENKCEESSRKNVSLLHTFILQVEHFIKMVIF